MQAARKLAGRIKKKPRPLMVPIVGATTETESGAVLFHDSDPDRVISLCARNGVPFYPIARCPLCRALLDFDAIAKHLAHDHDQPGVLFTVVYPQWWDASIKRGTKA